MPRRRLFTASAFAAGGFSPRFQGVAIVLHLLGLAHNTGHGNHGDVAAHVGAIVATVSGSRTAHAAAMIYDAWATRKHAKRAFL